MPLPFPVRAPNLAFRVRFAGCRSPRQIVRRRASIRVSSVCARFSGQSPPQRASMDSTNNSLPTQLCVTDQQLWRDLTFSAARISAQLEAGLQGGHAVTLSEYDVLENLSRAEGDSLSMSCVQALATTSVSGLSRSVSRLVSKGLVEKSPSLHDRRVNSLHLTSRGRDEFLRMQCTVSEIVVQSLLSCTSKQQRETLAQILRQVASSLN